MHWKDTPLGAAFRRLGFEIVGMGSLFVLLQPVGSEEVCEVPFTPAVSDCWWLGCRSPWVTDWHQQMEVILRGPGTVQGPGQACEGAVLFNTPPSLIPTHSPVWVRPHDGRRGEFRMAAGPGDHAAAKTLRDPEAGRAAYAQYVARWTSPPQTFEEYVEYVARRQ